MTNPTDKRLIEHFIPIKQISAEASREKSIRHGHISTLHLWWARRPLVASRAAVFAALVPAPAAATKHPSEITPDDVKEAEELNQLMIDLCKWEVTDETLEKARAKIREAYPDSPPKVLDMFAGGGSIPLEALRLGCEAYALDLNPVAHIIELATLVYPQKYGKQLAEDVKKWGQWVLERVRAEVGDLYPLIPDPEFTPEKAAQHTENVRSAPKQQRLFPSDKPEQLEMDFSGAADEDDDAEDTAVDPAAVPPGYLQPVAYLWTRTVTCPNPGCRATVPLVRQTWLKKKKNDNVALEMKSHPTGNRMAFYVRKATDPADFGFDPAGFSQRGNSVCYRCGTTVTSDYVKTEGKAGRMSAQMMATVCVKAGSRGKVYLSPDEHGLPVPNNENIRLRIQTLSQETGIEPPNEEIETNPRSMDNEVYGFMRWSSLFSSRQMISLLTFVKYIRLAFDTLDKQISDHEYAKAIATYLAILLDKVADYSSTLCRWRTDEFINSTFAGQSLPMVWDFAEGNSHATSSGSAINLLKWMVLVLNEEQFHNPAVVERGSATSLPYSDASMDALITDPPYYDNVSYSNLSDFYYVWLKRSLSKIFPEHFTNELSPKKNEAIAAFYRHNQNRNDAAKYYEHLMQMAFLEAYRVLRESAPMTVVYAHKTTAGWATLVDALRNAGFRITEAWPLDTEMPNRTVAMNRAALASSIFLSTRKRENSSAGDYMRDVQPGMQRIVKERVRFFLEQGITGADLNIATVGAGLAPFTRYARVELPNGEELTAAAYLDDVQGEVVKVLLGEASKTDPVTQYAIMWRSYYAEAVVEFDEANTLARATGVELDSGSEALSRGGRALVEKKGSKVTLHDFETRGKDDQLGLPREDGRKAPLIDVLHRLLYLAEYNNAEIQNFLNMAQPDKYLLRLTAQALSGKALAGEPTPGAVRDERTKEQRAIDTLLASWRRLIDEKAGF